MSLVASQITNLTIVYSTVYLGADQIKLQSSASLAFVRGIHRGPVNSPHKRPVTRKMFPFDDVIMGYELDLTVTRLDIVSHVIGAYMSLYQVQGGKGALSQTWGHWLWDQGDRSRSNEVNYTYGVHSMCVKIFSDGISKHICLIIIYNWPFH